MRRAEDIILRPFITEKSNDSLSEGKYTFIVATDATKTEIKYAVEKLFQVKVVKVNTASYEGKVKRMGVHVGSRPDWKKAIVKIDLDPSADKVKMVRVAEKVQKVDKEGKPVASKNGEPVMVKKTYKDKQGRIKIKYKVDEKGKVIREKKTYSPGAYLAKGGKLVTLNKKYKTSIEEFGVGQ